MTFEAQNPRLITSRGTVGRGLVSVLREAMRTHRDEQAGRRAFAREIAAFPATRSAAVFFHTHGR